MKTRVPADPQPQPPTEPGLSDCCGSGCSPCIFDLYHDALERWEVDFAAWQQRQAAQAAASGAAPLAEPAAAAPPGDGVVA